MSPLLLSIAKDRHAPLPLRLCYGVITDTVHTDIYIALTTTDRQVAQPQAYVTRI